MKFIKKLVLLILIQVMVLSTIIQLVLLVAVHIYQFQVPQYKLVVKCR